MFPLIFFGTVLLFALVLNIIDKVRSFRSPKRTVWQDGDSVIVQSDEKSDKAPSGFSHRIS